MTQWFYNNGQEPAGPLSEADFLALVHNKTIGGDTLVWSAELEDWQALSATRFAAEIPMERDPNATSRLRIRGRTTEGGVTPQPGKLEAPANEELPAAPTAAAGTPLTFTRKMAATPGAAAGGESGTTGAEAAALDPAQASFSRIQHPKSLTAHYDGTAKELFPLYLKNVVLTVLTLGIYRFWAQVHIRRYHQQHSSFAGGRFDYHATGKERFSGFLRALVILVPLIAGLYFAYRYFEGNHPEWATAATFYSFLVIMYLLRPLILVGSRRFRLARTSWNNIRFRFAGTPGPLYRIYLVDTLAMICTLGIYYAWHECKVKRFLRENASLGGESFRYDGKGSELFGLYFVNGFLTNITLGVYAPWAYAKLYRFHLENTCWQSARFRTNLTGGAVFGTGLLCAVVTVCTLGLGLPWAIAQWKGLHINSISAHGVMDTSHLVGEADADASAFAEGLGEAGEALETLGDLFG